jgi:decaprenyl-phosphate phosphoribosyltransferase
MVSAATLRLPALLRLARPRQWVKNLLVLAAAAAAGALGEEHVWLRVAITCLAFCLLASGIYAVNDVRDADEDRRHPRKRLRPVASGELSPRLALVAGGISILAGLAACVTINPLTGVVGLGYVVLTLTYTILWRHLIIFDLLAIAGGFVLRAVAGGTAAPVRLSVAFLLVVTFAALLIAAGKRDAELARSSADLSGKRLVLHRYSHRTLRLLMGLSTVGAVAAYVYWALEQPTVGGFPWRPLSALPFALALLRYLALVRVGHGEAPEDLLLRDRAILWTVTAWAVVFALGVHAGA